MREPVVSLVVVNWNGRHLLEECLPALDALAYPRDRRELLVVDNASTDGSIEWLRRRWPEARLLPSTENVGFALACNRAAAEAAGEIVAFINNDLWVEPDWLTRMVAALDATGAAAAGGTILDWDGGHYDFAGASMNFYGHGASRRHGHAVTTAALDEARRAAPVPALFASGGAMIADRRRFLAAGGFDPDYFAYFEDVDLGWRLWVRGEQVVYVPGALARHRQHGSGMAEDARLRLLERNALASVAKNYEDAHVHIVLAAALLLVDARARAAGACREAIYRDTVTGFVDALPALWAKREAVQACRRRPDREIVPLFGEPLRPSLFGQGYWREQQRVVRAFGIADMLGIGGGAGAAMDDFIADLQARIEELERALEDERHSRAESEQAARTAESRLHGEIARLRGELDDRRRPALRRLWRGVRARLG